MAVPKNIQYLNFLSDFWVDYYADAPMLDHALGAVAEVLKSYYFRFLQKSAPLAVQDMPVFDEQFWNIIELFADKVQVVSRNGERYYKYPLDEAYAHIPMLYNIIYNPTLVLKENVDYLFEVTFEDPALRAEDTSLNINSFILFKEKVLSLNNPFTGDPLTNNEIAKRVVDGNRISMVLFAPKAYIDRGDLYLEYGSLLNVKAKSSPEYKNFLHGLLYLYIKGPSISALNAGINLAAGYPVARQTEVVRTVTVVQNAALGINEFNLVSDAGNLYTIPRKLIYDFNNSTNSTFEIVFPLLKLSGKTYYDRDNKVNVTNPDFSNPLLAVGVYSVYYEVDRLDTFLDNLKIVDSQSQPNWWRSQLGTMAKEMAPQLTDVQRRDPVIQEFLFQRYFKYNTFGVFVDLRTLREGFQLVNEFFDILKEVKPAFKSFIIYEDDLKIITVVTSGNTATDPGLLDSKGNLKPQFSNGVQLSYSYGVQDIIGTDPEINMSLPYLDDTGYQRGAIPIEIGMMLENVGSVYDIPSFSLTHLSTSNSGARSSYIIGDGNPLIVGRSDLEIGMLPNEQVVEFPSLVFTEAPQQSPLSFDGRGPYSIHISWAAVAGADEYLILKDGEPLKFTNLTYTADPTTALTHLYEIVAIFGGFLSKPSRGYAILPPHSVMLYYMTEAVGVTLHDLSEFTNNGEIKTRSVIPELLRPVFLYPLVEGLGSIIGDNSGNAINAAIQTRSDTIADTRLFVYPPLSDAGGAVFHNLAFSGNDAALLLRPAIEHYRSRYLFFTKAVLDSSTHVNNATVQTSTPPLTDFVFQYSLATRDVAYFNDTQRGNDATRSYIGLVNNMILNYTLSDGTGVTLSDSSVNNKSATRLQIDPLPNQGNLTAAYLFNDSLLDSSAAGSHIISLEGNASVASRALYLKYREPQDYAVIPVAVLNGLNTFSVTAWVRILNTTSFKQHSILTGINSTLSDEMVLHIYNHQVTIVKQNVSYQFTAIDTITDSTYHHLAVCCSATSASLYVDGVFKQTIALAGAAFNITSMFVGVDFTTGGFDEDHCLSGYLDNLFVYNIELDAAGVTAAMSYTRT